MVTPVRVQDAWPWAPSAKHHFKYQQKENRKTHPSQETWWFYYRVSSNSLGFLHCFWVLPLEVTSTSLYYHPTLSSHPNSSISCQTWPIRTFSPLLLPHKLNKRECVGFPVILILIAIRNMYPFLKVPLGSSTRVSILLNHSLIKRERKKVILRERVLTFIFQFQ